MMSRLSVVLALALVAGSCGDNNASGYPEHLSDWAFFTGDPRLQQPAPGVVPYAVIATLFADFAVKHRFIRLPAGQTIHYDPLAKWTLPVGTVIIKTFAYPVDQRHPELGEHIVETRLLVHETDAWHPVTYRWNDAQTDAVYEDSGPGVPVTWIDTTGTTHSQTYKMPNLNQCRTCHGEADFGLMRELTERGFEVGCHELKHDGKMFGNKTVFAQRAAKINAYMKEYELVGFRSPLTHRNPEWMQALEIEYDLSFFDTDPFEPIPGGAMSIWPFFLGHFVELPYTLVQDYTLTSILGETTPRLWLEKVNFIERYQGMALVNSHPDYLKEKSAWKVYREFLIAMKNRDGYWQALPREVAKWWRTRALVGSDNSSEAVRMDIAELCDGELELTMQKLPKSKMERAQSR